MDARDRTSKPPGEPFWLAHVVRIESGHDGNKTVKGSGHLVAPNLVLTARHVVLGSAPGPEGALRAVATGQIELFRRGEHIAVAVQEIIDLPPSEESGSSAPTDAVLLRLDSSIGEGPFLRLAATWPAAGEVEIRTSDEADQPHTVRGTLDPEQKGVGTIKIGPTTRGQSYQPDSKNEWGGISGSAVVTHKGEMVGIVVEEDPGSKTTLRVLTVSVLKSFPELMRQESNSSRDVPEVAKNLAEWSAANRAPRQGTTAGVATAASSTLALWSRGAPKRVLEDLAAIVNAAPPLRKDSEREALKDWAEFLATQSAEEMSAKLFDRSVNLVSAKTGYLPGAELIAAVVEGRIAYFRWNPEANLELDAVLRSDLPMLRGPGEGQYPADLGRAVEDWMLKACSICFNKKLSRLQDYNLESQFRKRRAERSDKREEGRRYFVFRRELPPEASDPEETLRLAAGALPDITFVELGNQDRESTDLDQLLLDLASVIQFCCKDSTDPKR